MNPRALVNNLSGSSILMKLSTNDDVSSYRKRTLCKMTSLPIFLWPWNNEFLYQEMEDLAGEGGSDVFTTNRHRILNNESGINE